MGSVEIYNGTTRSNAVDFIGVSAWGFGEMCVSPREIGCNPLTLLVMVWLQVAKRLESTSRYFKRLGSLGFWGQLVCTVVAAVILSFSVVVTGKVSSPATFYATAGGIAAAFISVFWSFGYIRLSERLRRTANEPSKVL